MDAEYQSTRWLFCVVCVCVFTCEVRSAIELSPLPSHRLISIFSCLDRAQERSHVPDLHLFVGVYQSAFVLFLDGMSTCCRERREVAEEPDTLIIRRRKHVTATNYHT